MYRRISGLNKKVLPGFRSSLESLCCLLIGVAVLVARACDRYAEQQIEGYLKGYIERVVKISNTTKLLASPDPTGGLYVKSQTGQTVQVKMPRGCIAFQTGEPLEKITRGKFRAVPQSVRGLRASVSDGKIARNILAVVTRPNLGDQVDIDQHITFREFARGVVNNNTV
ncbi:hypothetical protein B0T10DRAFT_467323 [Thelonectria olida]|uniref:Uncharacterized protein n=1 Tax=Thelonectria olida TaxID=1576542 RepID=A0A9P8VPU6_9HYPO|nr:hypothetical protein B0T10DRAFT_467323 [Thelonectria olida]